jgi:hypothetical protein
MDYDYFFSAQCDDSRNYRIYKKAVWPSGTTMYYSTTKMHGYSKSYGTCGDLNKINISLQPEVLSGIMMIP